MLSLRELGVPVKVLQGYLREPSPERLSGIAAEQIQKIDMEIKKLRKIKGLLVNLSASTEEAVNAVLEQVRIETLPDQRFIYSQENDRKTDTSNQDWTDIYDDFVCENGIAGSAYVGSVISQTDLKRGQFGHVYRLFAVSPDRRGIVRKGRQYAVYYHKGGYDSIPGIYPYVLEEIKRQGFEVAGDAYEEYLIAEIATNCEEDYVTKYLSVIQNFFTFLYHHSDFLSVLLYFLQTSAVLPQ